MLNVRGLTKIYANRFDAQAGGVRDVSFELPTGTFFTLLGPSGCGKTTTLRSVAGLERPDAGRIAVDERVLFARDPAGGSAAGGGAKPAAKTEVAERVRRVLEVMQLADYIDRRAIKLSGGQQQRLALARALVTQPPLLLLDEPLSNLDAKLRESLRFELKRLQRDLGVTSVYVTHDQTEALALSSKIAVMRDGRVRQIGRPRDVYERPGSRFVAEFIGSSNFLPGTVTAA